jgi:hypothetical protein
MIHILGVAAVVAVVAGTAFLLGIWHGYGRNMELVEELEAELTARRLDPPAELAHEPATVVLEPAAVLPAAAADTSWDLPAVRLEGIEDLDIWIATVIADTDRFMAYLRISQ